jgi:hypothetical protein
MTAPRHRSFRPSLHQLESRDVPSVFTPTDKDRLLLVGSDVGTTARIWSFTTNGSVNPVIYYDSDPVTPVYESTFRGGVRVATIRAVDPLFGGPVRVFAPGPGRAADVKVVYPATGPHPSQQGHTDTFTAFEPTFLGGAFVAVGDFSGTGTDIVVTPDEGGGPRVRILRNGDPNVVVADFLGIDDANFRGGVRPAIGDVNNDNVPDLIVAAGVGGGPRIAVWDGTTLKPGVVPKRLLNDFFVFEQTLRNGVYVAAGDVNGDGFADLFAGGGPGGGPRVYGLSGKGLVAGTVSQVANFFAGDPDNRDGVRLTIKDIDGDNRADLVTGVGAVANAVTAYAGVSMPANGTPAVAKRFVVHAPFTDVDIGFRSGVYLG